jgi:hypothetical protein
MWVAEFHSLGIPMSQDEVQHIFAVRVWWQHWQDTLGFVWWQPLNW